MRAIILLVSLIAVVASLKSSPSATLSTEDRSVLRSALTSQQRKDGSWGSVAETHYAVSSLTSLGAEIPNKASVCTYLQSSTPSDVESAAHVALASKTLSCSANEKATQILKGAASSGKVRDLAYAVLTGHGSDSLAEKILELAEEDGTFLDSKQADGGSIYNTALAFRALATFKLSGAVREKLNTAYKNALDLSAEETDGMLEFVDTNSGVSNLRVTSELFAGLDGVARVLGVDTLKSNVVTQEQVVQLTNYFLQNRFTSSAEAVDAVLSGLHTSTDNVFAIPVVVALVSNQHNLNAQGDVRVSVTDVLGRAVAGGVGLSLVQAYPAGDNSRPLLTAQEVPAVANEATLFHLNVLAAKPEAGSYTLEFKVTPTSKKYIEVESARLTLRVVGSVSITDFQVVVADSEDSNDVSGGIKHKVEAGKTQSQAVTVKANQHIFVEYKIGQPSTGRAVKVHQSFVTLVNKATGQEFTTVAQVQGRQHRVHISLPQSGSQVDFRSGAYELRVFVGDFAVENAITWTPITLDIQFPSTTKAVEHTNHFAAKQPIEWTFRAPDARAGKSLSFAFSLACLAPLAILVIGFPLVGANLSNFPGGITGIYALLFQGGLGLTLALYAFYWLRLNMMQTLSYLPFILIPTYFFGFKTLNYLYANSQGKTKQE